MAGVDSEAGEQGREEEEGGEAAQLGKFNWKQSLMLMTSFVNIWKWLGEEVVVEAGLVGEGQG